VWTVPSAVASFVMVGFDAYEVTLTGRGDAYAYL